MADLIAKDAFIDALGDKELTIRTIYFSTTSINFSGRDSKLTGKDSKLTICNSPCYAKKACSAFALLAQLHKKLAQLLTWLKNGSKTNCSFLQFQWYLTCCCIFSIIKSILLSPFYIYSNRCQYSEARSILQRAYQKPSSFYRKVHWVSVLTNIKTATGCESNRKFNFEMRLQGRLCIVCNLTELKGWASNKMSLCLANNHNIDSIEG